MFNDLKLLEEAIELEYTFSAQMYTPYGNNENSEYHNRVAEWLEELKDMKSKDVGYTKEDIQLNRQASYNKAIDDFVTRCKCMNIDDFNYPSSCVKVVAEQLKVGGDNGNL